MLLRGQSEVVSVKPEMQKVGEARRMDCLGKTARSEHSRPKRGAMGATANHHVLGVEPSKLWSSQLATDFWVMLDMEPRDLMLILLGFCLALFPFFIVPI